MDRVWRVQKCDVYLASPHIFLLKLDRSNK